jgi:hypothetical protein
MQRAAAWNRMVTRRVREQPNTTPVATTWTADFLTREGEGRKAMSDWLRDKSIPWKVRRRLLPETIREHFRASPASRNGVSTRMECGPCKRCREVGLGLLVGNPLEASKVIYKAACEDFKLHRSLAARSAAISKVKKLQGGAKGAEASNLDDVRTWKRSSGLVGPTVG